LRRALQFGTLPGVYLGADEFLIPTLETYTTTYLQEEILAESLVRAIDRFHRFLELAAQLNGEPINYSKLGKQIGSAGKTIQEYFNILVDTLIAFHLPGWATSVRKQLLQAPKYYFFDCGVLNAINGYLRIELKESSFLYGRLFENFIITQLIGSSDYASLGYRFYYWRDKNGAEVDLILARNATTPLYAIEIKSASEPAIEDMKGFRSFAEDYPEVPRLCVCQTPRRYEREGISFLPWREALLLKWLEEH
jgi:predicted AAA+ superfamily ATPase